jgi:hypothetical protein
LFHYATFFGSCIIHILHTGCANIKKKSGAKGLMQSSVRFLSLFFLSGRFIKLQQMKEIAASIDKSMSSKNTGSPSAQTRDTTIQETYTSV